MRIVLPPSRESAFFDTLPNVDTGKSSQIEQPLRQLELGDLLVFQESDQTRQVDCAGPA